MAPLKNTTIVIAWLSIFTSSCLDSNNQKNYSRVHSDSGIVGRPYQEIVSDLRSLEQKFPKMAKVINYGTTIGGEDLTMIRIGQESTQKKERRGVLIAGAIHGDEFLNIEDRLPRWFLENQQSPGVSKYLNSGGVIWIAPILNPDGYTARRRENNQGKDLNRDFNLQIANKKGFTQPETTNLYNKVREELAAQNAKLTLTLDYHCCVGALLYPWGHSYTKELPSKEKAEHLRLGKIILDQFPGYKTGRAIEIVNYVAVGASDDFYHETFQTTSFTFEGSKDTEKDKFAAHTKMWDALLATQAGDLPGPNPLSTGAAPNLAIVESNQSGLLLHASGSTGTTGIALCKGNVTTCDLSSSLVTFSQSQKIQDRLIFKAGRSIAVNSNELFTVVSHSISGSQRSVVRFLSK